jgi:hypothetical protein
MARILFFDEIIERFEMNFSLSAKLSEGGVAALR